MPVGRGDGINSVEVEGHQETQDGGQLSSTIDICDLAEKEGTMNSQSFS